MATCADIVRAHRDPDDGEDSVSILPLLRDPHADQGVRAFTVHHSMRGRFALRRGDWVFIDSESGGDNPEPDWFAEERGYTRHDHPGELYNLADDIGERHNLYAQHPDLVAELSGLLEQVKKPEGGASQSL